jgi:hypothetical protein
LAIADRAGAVTAGLTRDTAFHAVAPCRAPVMAARSSAKARICGFFHKELELPVTGMPMLGVIKKGRFP